MTQKARNISVFFRVFPWQNLKVVKSVGEVYEIMPLPHSSNDYEQVIDWLRHFQGKRNLKPIFKLADEQYIRPTHEISDYQMAQFDKPFKLWKSLLPIVLNN
ncbi:MAG: hypothetical protein DRR16_18425 [Candidatus Parabeggiatoa sp. nov. 3]|nr:MAG: hypothetical protein DRR00_22945 [Gammaproteobacteria bacterium]RKZ61682.1 MAG: hypothetical protein DRQ99_20030 [Gammaproteobacteria bacterium]RKZ82998.1 MAG: hypothetical protein DRR16_18425 [Gammaproteobacteria bacterium]HEW98690.1 hypothetical protein [Beggiatoa sp.]